MNTYTEDFVVKVNSLYFSYDGNSDVLKDISFTIDKGSFVAIIGPNGSGKTTLAKILCGLEKGYRGNVEIKGKIGFLPQITRINPYFPVSVRRVVEMGLYGENSPSILKPIKNKDRVERCLKSVEMEKFIDSPFAHLSGGQRQRVLIARVLAQDPDILILDEPQTGLDVKSRMELVRIINNVREKRKITVIMITHFLNELLPFIDEVMYVRHKLYLKGKPDEVLSEDILEEIYGVPVKIAEVSGYKCVIVEDVHHD